MDARKIDFDAANASQTGVTLSDEEIESMSDNGCLDDDS